MKKLWRRLRLRFDDWRSGTRVAFGGPLDGKRLPWLTIGGYEQRQYYVCITGIVFWRHVPRFCEGAYELIGRRFEWQQWSDVYAIDHETGEIRE